MSAPLLVLAITFPFFTKKAEPSAGLPKLPAPIVEIYCKGAPERARELLAEAQARYPKDRTLALFDAQIAMEQGEGPALLARLQKIAREGQKQTIDLSCDGRPVLKGAVDQLAQGLAAEQRNRLAELGVLFDEAEAQRLAEAAEKMEAANAPVIAPEPPPAPKPVTTVAKVKTKPKATGKKAAGDGVSSGAGKSGGKGSADSGDNFTIASAIDAVKQLKGDTFVHIGTARSIDQAASVWNSLTAKYKAISGEAGFAWRVDLKRSGTRFYRLGLMMQNRDKGEALCATLTKAGQQCQAVSTFGYDRADFARLDDLVRAAEKAKLAAALKKEEQAKRDEAARERLAGEADARLKKAAAALAKKPEEELLKESAARAAEAAKSKPKEEKPAEKSGEKPAEEAPEGGH